MSTITCRRPRACEPQGAPTEGLLPQSAHDTAAAGAASVCCMLASPCAARGSGVAAWATSKSTAPSLSAVGESLVSVTAVSSSLLATSTGNASPPIVVFEGKAVGWTAGCFAASAATSRINVWKLLALAKNSWLSYRTTVMPGTVVALGNLRKLRHIVESPWSTRA